jgi:plasmid stabilization system protein ParE
VKVVWTEQAWERLIEIEAFIGRDDPGAASRLIDRLLDRAEKLARHPDSGRTLPELPNSGLRELVVDRYRIIHRRGPKAIEVLTVFEGHRLLRRGELSEGRG